MAKPKPFGVGSARVRVERGPREDGRWYWRADRLGPDKRRAALWSGWATKREAEDQVLDVLKGEPKGGRTASVAIVTVRDLLECWVASHAGREDIADRTRVSARGSAKRLVERLDQLPIEDLNRRALEQFRDAALRDGCAGSTIQRDMKTLRQAWRWGREIGQVPTDRDLPSVRVLRVKRVYTDFTPTRAQIAQVLAKARPDWVRRTIILLWATGARIGEIASLRWSDVRDNCVLVNGKTGEREVPLHPDIMAQVRSWPRTGDTVLGHSHAAVVTKTQQELARLSTELEFAGKLSPHGLRRAACDALYRSGIPPEVAASMLGHSAMTALAHYRQVSAEDRAEAATKARLGLPTPEEDK